MSGEFHCSHKLLYKSPLEKEQSRRGLSLNESCRGWFSVPPLKVVHTVIPRTNDAH